MRRRHAAWAAGAWGPLLLLVGPGCGGGSTADEAAAATSTVTTEVPATSACLLTDEAVEDAVGEPVTAKGPVTGGTGGLPPGASDYGLSWRGCSYQVMDGSRVTVAELVGADGEPDASGVAGLDAAASPAGDAVRRPSGLPAAVDGIGDDAFMLGGRLYVRVGERAAMVEGETAGGQAMAPALLGVLGTAATLALV